MVDSRHFLPFGPQSVPGQRDEPRMQDIPQLGTVLSITSKGAKVELDARRGEFYGPAPWTLGVYDTAALAITAGYAPRVGDKVVVLFAGVGIDTPVIVAWWR
jgi:hypothetical protein